MVNEEYVDLDELNQGAEIKKTSEPVQKKENVAQEASKQVQEKPQPKPEVVDNNKAKEAKKETKVEENIKQQTSKPKVVPIKKEAKKSIQKKKTPEVKTSQKKTVSSSKAQRDKEPKKERKSKGKETKWTTIALLIIAAVIIGVIVYLAFAKGLPTSNKETVVAVVNGEPIYKSDVTNRYNLLSMTMDPFITEEQILNMTIMDTLLVQEAKKRGITTSDEEITNLMTKIMIENGIDEASLKQDLESKNVSYEYILKLYKNTMTITKLMNSSFLNLSVSEEELKDLYETNKELLKVPDMVQVRHILFLFGEEPETDTYARAQDVENKIKSDKSNFCDLVLNYSDDEGSVETCGEYNFSIDYPFVPEFLDAGFNMKKGEVRIVKTQLGYHIMYKVANLPGYTPALEDVKSSLETVILEDKTLAAYKSLLDRLQKEAIIEIYSEEIPAKEFKEITASKEPVKEDIVKENSVQKETEAPAVEQQTQVEVTKEIISTPESELMLFANCLTDKGARMFTASWSPDSEAQLALFENYASSLTIVECDPSAKGANVAECSSVLKKQFPTWPTWEINGTLYEGIQSLNALSRYSGCQY